MTDVKRPPRLLESKTDDELREKANVLISILAQEWHCNAGTIRMEYYRRGIPRGKCGSKQGEFYQVIENGRVLAPSDGCPCPKHYPKGCTPHPDGRMQCEETDAVAQVRDRPDK